jgi:hypothetical protein
VGVMDTSHARMASLIRYGDSSMLRAATVRLPTNNSSRLEKPG